MISQPTPNPINGTAGEIYRTQRLEVNIVHSALQQRHERPVLSGHGAGLCRREALPRLRRRRPETTRSRRGRRDRRCRPSGAEGSGTAGAAARPHALDGGCQSTTARTPREGEFSMEFDAGRLSAGFGCNGMGAGYAQTNSTPGCRRDHHHQDGLFRRAELGEPRERHPPARSCRSSALAPNRIRLDSSAGSIPTASGGGSGSPQSPHCWPSRAARRSVRRGWPAQRMAGGGDQRPGHAAAARLLPHALRGAHARRPVRLQPFRRRLPGLSGETLTTGAMMMTEMACIPVGDTPDFESLGMAVLQQPMRHRLARRRQAQPVQLRRFDRAGRR